MVAKQDDEEWQSCNDDCPYQPTCTRGCQRPEEGRRKEHGESDPPHRLTPNHDLGAGPSGTGGAVAEDDMWTVCLMDPWNVLYRRPGRGERLTRGEGYRVSCDPQ